MKIFLKKFGTVLVSRPAGKEAYLALKSSMEKIAEKEKIEIDFEGVSVLTLSFANEFITPLKKDFGDEKIVLKNTENPSVKATLETLGKAGKLP